MVIFDTKNKNKNELGVLYLSVADLDYIVKRYDHKLLKEIIPKGTITLIKEELSYALCDDDKLSQLYFSLISFSISKDNKEFLEFIRTNVEEGRLYTRKLIINLHADFLTFRINELLKQESNGEISLEELYQLRTFILANQIKEDKKQMGLILDKWDADNLYDVYSYKRFLDDLKDVGIDREIYESDYFDENNKELIKC